ncbi:MAG: hypothetical protein FWF70_05460 [Bacteroidetes bacterium]|nr:hypothetical protein [Bacteroidota bacterium]MCL1968503.1 hypothetical protein [Bacteroidota bacterium]
MVTLAGPKGSTVDGLKLDAGAFCRNGITVPDNGKMDFIGHLTVVLKYAVMNPNTKISKKGIDNKTDLTYNYFGYGLLVRCTSNLRLMCFYEMPFNTKSGAEDPLATKPDAKPATGFNHVKDYTKHVKESIFTCRLQFKF